MRHKQLDEQKAQIIERYTIDKAPTTKIAEEYGVVPNTIINRLREWDVEIRPVGQRYTWLDEEVDEIVERYVTRQESLKTIAARYGTTPSPIKRRLLEAGVELRPREYSFSEDQISILEGELLGDGCIYRRHGNACHFRLESSVRTHPSYVRDQLPNGVFPNNHPYSVERSTEWGDAIHWILHSRGQKLFDELHEHWYEKYDDCNRKIVPDRLELNEISLYHWYIGDGCLSKRRNGSYRIHLSTHGFPDESVHRLQTQLESMGYDNYTSQASHVKTGSGLAIFVSRASSRRLLPRLSARNTIDEYEYKFDAG